MGVKELPEIKLAKKIINKHSLTVPFDLDNLVQKYANIIYRSIPIDGIDGVSLNLKSSQKKPTIIVNKEFPPKRQRFTLAHELGHIIIPWHLGTIIDKPYSQSYKDLIYSILEGEANRFAAELLMPTDWIQSQYNKKDCQLGELQKRVTNEANVSDQAAAIRLIGVLPSDIVYTAEEAGNVIHSGKTAYSNAFIQVEGNKFNENFYEKYFDEYSTYNTGYIKYHWWKLDSDITIDEEDERSWREILDSILEDLGSFNPAIKSSINGIIANANGNVKRKGNYSVEAVVAASIHRLRRNDLKDFTSHPDFEIFVKRKAEDLFNKEH